MALTQQDHMTFWQTLATDFENGKDLITSLRHVQDLLYTMLMEINRPEACVLTVEDPVECAFEGMGQVQINPGIGLTFPRVIRSLLRQDPDVMMVGEIRDLEVAQLCVQVALTGHLLLTTLHAQTSVGAIRRLLDMGLVPFLVSSTLSAVVSQRLIRKLCPDCRRPSDVPAHVLPPEAMEFISSLPDVGFCECVGCEKCQGTGFRGRTALFEVLIVNDPLRQLITAEADNATLLDAARRSGMRTLLEDGLAKAAQGITAIQEILRVVPFRVDV